VGILTGGVDRPAEKIFSLGGKGRPFFFLKKERKKKDVREGLLELQFSSPVSVLLLLIECKSTFCGAKREEFSSDRVLAGHSMQPWLFWMPTPVWWVPGAFPCLVRFHRFFFSHLTTNLEY